MSLWLSALCSLKKRRLAETVSETVSHLYVLRMPDLMSHSSLEAKEGLGGKC